MSNPTNTPVYYTPSNIADLLLVKRRTIYVWIRDKKLPAIKVGNRVRIHRDALEEFLAVTK